uniref:Uncharacterized protein n=1 Tax=Arundo donax TaxID=35708 RepID=A0A0A9AJ96_ARUDO
MLQHRRSKVYNLVLNIHFLLSKVGELH